MTSVRNEYQKFVRHLTQDHEKWKYEFLSIFLASLLARHTVVLARMGEAIVATPSRDLPLSERAVPSRNAAKQYHTIEKYLSNNLSSSKLDMWKVWDRCLERCAPILRRNSGEGVNLAVDTTDFGKPFARPNRPRGMQGATMVRDGSASTREHTVKRMGFEGVTVEASTPDGNHVPLAMHLFSRDVRYRRTEVTNLSDQNEVMAVLRRVLPHVGGRAWVSLDSAFFAGRLLTFLDEMKSRWIVRVPVNAAGGRRMVRTEDGFELPTEKLAYTLMPSKDAHRLEIQSEDGGRPLVIRVVLAKVRLRRETSNPRSPWEDRDRTLLIAKFNEATTPFVLMASEWLEDTADTAELFRREYRRRWTVEETHRLAKHHEGWGGDVEAFRALQFESNQRIVLGWMLISAFVAILRDEHRNATKAFAAEAHAPGEVPPDPRYRLNAVIGHCLGGWVPKAWRERTKRNRWDPPAKPPEVRDAERDDNRLKNARRAVARAERAIQKRSSA